jgi:transposase-like protein
MDEHGDKHVLCLREGATENAMTCKALLADLIERGLDPSHSLLVVIDGAKALHKAVVEAFGARALIQRCRAHKKRNVSPALPERLRGSMRTAMNQAYATGDAKRARRLLDNLARRFEDQHPGAAASLREGLGETLTVMHLALPENLERVLSSTNLNENLFSRVREIGRRVRRWQSGTKRVTKRASHKTWSNYMHKCTRTAIVRCRLDGYTFRRPTADRDQCA